MGYEGTNAEATVKEVFLAATSQDFVSVPVLEIKDIFQTGNHTDQWLNKQFTELAQRCIRLYGQAYAENMWISETIKDQDIVSELARKLREYYMENEAGDEENIS